jgi:F-type H+-transporting ATPase subunit epsilon
MASTFTVEVVSAERKLWSGEATGLFFTTTEGSMGVLPGHQPVLAALDIAGAHVELADGSREYVAVHRGYVYYSGGDTAIILADIAELAHEIDVDRARQQLFKLENLKDAESVPFDVPAAAKSHRTRIEVAEKAQGKG